MLELPPICDAHFLSMVFEHGPQELVGAWRCPEAECANGRAPSVEAVEA